MCTDDNYSMRIKPCYHSRTETQRKQIWLRVLLNYKTCMKIQQTRNKKWKKKRVNINYSKNPLIKSTQDDFRARQLHFKYRYQGHDIHNWEIHCDGEISRQSTSRHKISFK